MNQTLAKFVAECRQQNLGFRQSMALFEKAWLEYALMQNRNNQCETAKEIGVHRNTIHRHIQKLDIRVSERKNRTAAREIAT